VEPDAGDGVEKAVAFWVGENFWVDDGACLGGESFERVDELVDTAGVLFRGLFWGRISRRWVVLSIDSFGLFCLVLKEGHKELTDTHLFALGPVDAGEQRGDDTFLKLQFLTETGHFRSKICNLSVLLIEAFMRVGGVPDFGLFTSFIVLRTKGVGGHRAGRCRR